MINLNNINSIQIKLASSKKILSWSRGEVKKPETINYRTLKPVMEGLFCERIFGPIKDWECSCGKYSRKRFQGIVCDRCGVEVAPSIVRRERMGHIELAAPVLHIWYFKATPSRVGLLLDMSPRALEKVLYFDSYVVIDPGETYLRKGQLLSEAESKECYDKYNVLCKTGRGFRVGIGAEAIKELLLNINLQQLSTKLKNELKSSNSVKRIRAIRRLEVVEAFRQSGNDPSSMILDVIPVIPPDLRPMVQYDGSKFATSDLNDLYRRVINRNNRLKRLLYIGAPDIIVRNEKRMLQEAVDALIDNSSRSQPVIGPGNRPLKSLSDMLKWKNGHLRVNLLGKRVDYSGNTVVVPNPNYKLYQCGFPREMALELFKPFVMRSLVSKGLTHNIKGAKRMVEKMHPRVWNVLEEVVKGYPVLINRTPTLQRLGIQAFEPVLEKTRSIRINPIMFNSLKANTAGDQVTVHIPLSINAQNEANSLMYSAHNIFSPRDGRLVVTPTAEIFQGCYYLTREERAAKGEGKIFKDTDEAIVAYHLGHLNLQARIFIHCKGFQKSELARRRGYVLTTVGKAIFNHIFPPDFPYINNADFTKLLPADNLITPGNHNLQRILETVPLNQSIHKDFLEKVISRCCCRFGNTVTTEILHRLQKLGLKFATRAGTTVSVKKSKMHTTADYIKMAISNRKQMVASELASINSRYFTRRLVDVAHDVIVREEDCGTSLGINLNDYLDSNQDLKSVINQMVGRYTLKPVYHPQTGAVIIKANQVVTEDTAEEIFRLRVSEVYFRSVLTCQTLHGVCVKCYGHNPASSKTVRIGEAVGIIAAQSIGELNNQMIMRTPHHGSAAEKDFTQSMRRVENLLEARNLSSLNRNELLKEHGVYKFQLFLLKELHRIYRNQDVDINDKHIEVIIRQMLKKLKVEDSGDTALLPGRVVDRYLFKEINKAVAAMGGRQALARPLLLGITKASLTTDSFLSAASFQNPIQALTDASIKGKIDYLLGLKENVIIGNLIPAGTGMRHCRYHNIKMALLASLLPLKKSNSEEEYPEDSWDYPLEDWNFSGEDFKI